MRDNPSLRNVKSVEDLATQFVNQGSLLGSSIRIPTEDTAEDQKAAFYEKLTQVPGVVRMPGPDASEEETRQFMGKLGVPATAGEYQIAEGFDSIDPEVVENYRQNAHALGLTNHQFNSLLQDQIQADKQAEVDYANYIEQARTELKSLWGGDFDARVAGATQALRIYSDEMPEAAKELEAVKNNPLFIRILSDMGQQLIEQGHAGMQRATNYGMTPEDARMKISEIMNNPDHGYFKGDQTQIDYMYKLREIVAGQSA